MTHDSTIYSQHQQGKHNIIADLLSRWHFMTDIQLTVFLRSISTSQLPTSFRISPLPNEVNSWITYILLKLQTTTASKRVHTMTENEHGNDGSPGWTRWAGKTTPSLLGFQEIKRPEWSAPLLSLFAEGNTVIPDTRSHWSLARSARPCQTWLRPFRTTITSTQEKQMTTTPIGSSQG